MPMRFDTDMGRLKEKLLKMGAIAEGMIRDVAGAVLDHEEGLLGRLAAREQQVDTLQREIDEEVVKLIAVHTPVAGDLRLLMSVTRINAEIERVGDQAMNIAFYAKTLLRCEELSSAAGGMPKLAQMAGEMLAGALDAFAHSSAEQARSVISTDDECDKLHDCVFRELMSRLVEDGDEISGVLELILTARALERIADHAVSIAEDVVYLVEGRDVRHTDGK